MSTNRTKPAIMILQYSVKKDLEKDNCSIFFLYYKLEYRGAINNLLTKNTFTLQGQCTETIMTEIEIKTKIIFQ